MCVCVQEPLPDDGSATPVSALCPVAGASEASNDSPAALLRAQHRPQQQQSMVAEAEEAEEMAAAREQQTAAQQQQQLQQQQQQGEVEPAGAEELLGLGRRSAGVALSGPSGTQYYDALDEPCAGAGSGLADTAASPAGTQPPASGTAEEPGEGPRHGLAALAAAVLARGAHHRRGLSASSATSTDTPTTGEEGAPGRQQPMSRRFWRRFNRDYGEWDAYWDTMGVEAEEVEGQPATRGIVSGALHAAEEMLRNSYYSTSILVALFLMRELPGRGGPGEDRAGRGQGEPEAACTGQAWGQPQVADCTWLRNSGTPKSCDTPKNCGNPKTCAAWPLPHMHAGNGWLRVQPDINADPHDEHTRQHAGHRHTRTHSSSGLGDASLPDLGGSSSEADASGRPLPPARAQSLTRVAQEVQKRLVSGSRAVAKAPVRAVAKAGSSMRQASLNWGDLFARPPRPSSANGNDRSSIDGSGKAGADGSVAGPLPPRPPIAAAAQAGGSGGNAMHGGGRHRKTVSLDTGTAAEARRAAAAAMEAHEQLAVGAGAGGMPAGVSPSKALQRRPSNMASLAMAASMERAEHRVHSHGGGRCRLSCFTICSRQPAVKD